MPIVRPSAIADRAEAHLGDRSPDNTCVSQGLELWTREAGLPGLGTASVSEARKLAKAGRNGWAYHHGVDGVRIGYFVDWDPDVLGDAADAHVSCVVDIDSAGGLKTIGAGGPTGQVAYQPRSGGHNPAGYFIGYFIPPTTAPAPERPERTEPAPASSSKTYTVQDGDWLLAIARRHGTSVPAILRANPPAADGKPRDFHITRANLILAGQKLHLPA